MLVTLIHHFLPVKFVKICLLSLICIEVASYRHLIEILHCTDYLHLFGISQPLKDFGSQQALFNFSFEFFSQFI